jgi:hypothetical protein
MKITAWKFGKGDFTVKYETSDGTYAIKTENEPEKRLYSAAAEVAAETKYALGFNFDGSFSAVSVSYGDNPNAVIVLDTGTAIGETAEVKCPKIDRRQHLDPDAEIQTLPGMDANTTPFVYNKFVELNLAIDVFLKEAEAFVLSKPRREPDLFDQPDISGREDDEDGKE